MTTPDPDLQAATGGLLTAEDMANIQSEIAAMTSGGTVSASDRAVPWGTDTAGIEPEHGGAATDYAKTTRPPGLSTLGAVSLETRRMDDPKLTHLAERMVAAGLLQPDYTRSDVEAVWDKLTVYAADWHQANPDSRLTPEDMIDIYKGRGEGAVSGTPGKAIRRDVQLSDSTQAWGLLRDVIRNELGRNPTDAEVDDFQSALNTAQTKAPVITTATTTTDAAGNSTVNQTKTGGMDEAGFTQKYTEDSHAKEHAAYQAATTYFSAFQDAIGRTA